MAPTETALSIVIPAFRECEKIENDIRHAHRFLLERLGGAGEIIVVDDGSPDDTAARARALRREIPELSVVSYQRNRGKGYALRAGIAATRGRRVLFADAGGCVRYDEALTGLQLLSSGAHVAHGSRRFPGAVIERRQPLHRRVGSALFRLGLRAGMGIPTDLRDTQCGFKLYDGDTARRLYGQCFTDGFMLDVELIRRASKQGLRIREFPVRWRADPDSRYRSWSGTMRNLRELVRIRLGC